jgi:hypothetical protein
VAQSRVTRRGKGGRIWTHPSAVLSVAGSMVLANLTAQTTVKNTELPRFKGRRQFYHGRLTREQFDPETRRRFERAGETVQRPFHPVSVTRSCSTIEP